MIKMINFVIFYHNKHILTIKIQAFSSSDFKKLVHFLSRLDLKVLGIKLFLSTSCFVDSQNIKGQQVEFTLVNYSLLLGTRKVW